MILVIVSGYVDIKCEMLFVYFEVRLILISKGYQISECFRYQTIYLILFII
jgi:hypothetical protein